MDVTGLEPAGRRWEASDQLTCDAHFLFIPIDHHVFIFFLWLFTHNVNYRKTSFPEYTDFSITSENIYKIEKSVYSGRIKN